MITVQLESSAGDTHILFSYDTLLHTKCKFSAEAHIIMAIHNFMARGRELVKNNDFRNAGI